MENLVIIDLATLQDLAWIQQQWEGNAEVDFVIRKGDLVTAIEVKSNSDSLRNSGMGLFLSRCKPDRCILIGNAGIPLEEFLQAAIENFIGL